MPITFTSGVDVVTIRSPSAPKRPRETLDQATARAMGGRVMSLTRSSQILEQPILFWADLPDVDDFQPMKTFLHVTVGGSTTQFTYTDELSQIMTVRYLGGILDAEAVDYVGVGDPQVDQLIWRVTIKLAEVPT